MNQSKVNKKMLPQGSCTAPHAAARVCETVTTSGSANPTDDGCRATQFHTLSPQSVTFKPPERDAAAQADYPLPAIRHFQALPRYSFKPLIHDPGRRTGKNHPEAEKLLIPASRFFTFILKNEIRLCRDSEEKQFHKVKLFYLTVFLPVFRRFKL